MNDKTDIFWPERQLALVPALVEVFVHFGTLEWISTHAAQCDEDSTIFEVDASQITGLDSLTLVKLMKRLMRIAQILSTTQEALALVQSSGRE